MTRDELTEMAQSYMDKSKPKSAFAFAKALDAVILMEREACAKVCDKLWSAAECAEAIRARGNNP